jgi:hypothetical protein
MTITGGNKSKQPSRGLATLGKTTFVHCAGKRRSFDRLEKNFWMDERKSQDDDYATLIADDLIMMKMKKELKILPDGHIELPTLWKQGSPQTQHNFECAKTRLFQLLGSKLLTSDPTLMKDYQAVFKK